MESLPKAGAWTKLQPPLHSTTLNMLKSLGFDQMTPVQEAVLPLFMSNKDVFVEAVTGSGKTLAFVIPILEILLKREHALRRNEVGALVIAPTRELAKQIAETIKLFIQDDNDQKKHHLSCVLLTGGVSANEDVQKMVYAGCNIVIGTPGKLNYVLTTCQEMVLKELEVLVLDEADKLLDLGFETTINSILNRLPKQRRTGLFSATMTEGLTELARAGLRNPVSVIVKVESVKSKQSQITPSTIFSELDIFKPIKKWSLHGKIPQTKRDHIYEQFIKAESGILMCTDVAARGLDIPDIDWVIQFDPPTDPKSFVHRCGRTARLGKAGSAISFLLPNEESYIEFLKIRKVPMVRLEVSNAFPDLLNKVKENVIKDHDLYDKGLKAFVSFIRAYKEHQCNYIFQFKELNIGACARAFALLRLPKMPELRNHKAIDFESTNIDINSIKYKDKIREKQRQFQIKNRLSHLEDKKPLQKRAVKNNEPWSENKQRKERKQDRKDKKIIKRKKGTLKQENFNNSSEKQESPLDHGDANVDNNEWNELQREARLVKKLKSGKITEAEFNESMGLDLDTEI